MHCGLLAVFVLFVAAFSRFKLFAKLVAVISVINHDHRDHLLVCFRAMSSFDYRRSRCSILIRALKRSERNARLGGDAKISRFGGFDMLIAAKSTCSMWHRQRIARETLARGSFVHNRVARNRRHSSTIPVPGDDRS
jgi:hypothetical protein